MFVKKYRRAERPGLYCRVVRAGTVQAGDEVLVERLSGERVTVLEIFREHYALVKDEDSLRRILAAPIAIRARASVEKHLKQLLDRS